MFHINMITWTLQKKVLNPLNWILFLQYAHETAKTAFYCLDKQLINVGHIFLWEHHFLHWLVIRPNSWSSYEEINNKNWLSKMPKWHTYYVHLWCLITFQSTVVEKGMINNKINTMINITLYKCKSLFGSLVTKNVQINHIIFTM